MNAGIKFSGDNDFRPTMGEDDHPTEVFYLHWKISRAYLELGEAILLFCSDDCRTVTDLP